MHSQADCLGCNQQEPTYTDKVPKQQKFINLKPFRVTYTLYPSLVLTSLTCSFSPFEFLTKNVLLLNIYVLDLCFSTSRLQKLYARQLACSSASAGFGFCCNLLLSAANIRCGLLVITQYSGRNIQPTFNGCRVDR